MTGLDISNDVIIEIAVIITNGQLEPVDQGVEWVIKTPKETMDAYAVNYRFKS
jgi:oligoribonuclease